MLGAAEEDWFQLELLVVALVLVFAAVELDWLEDVDGSAITGVVEVVVAVVVSLAVWEDLVLLLQPLRANPARSKVNNIVFFIGGLSCAPTDPGLTDRFATHVGDGRSARGRMGREGLRRVREILRGA